MAKTLIYSLTKFQILMKTNYPLLMTEEFWANSQLSVARYYGGVTFEGREYIIVDKLGRDLWECSAIAAREGRRNAIEPGEPAVRRCAGRKKAGNENNPAFTL